MLDTPSKRPLDAPWGALTLPGLSSAIPAILHKTRSLGRSWQPPSWGMMQDKEPAVPEGASSGLGTIQEGLGQVQQVLQRLEMLVKLRAPYGTPSKPCKEPMFGETVPLYAWLGQEHARLRSLQGMLRWAPFQRQAPCCLPPPSSQ